MQENCTHRIHKKANHCSLHQKFGTKKLLLLLKSEFELKTSISINVPLNSSKDQRMNASFIQYAKSCSLPILLFDFSLAWIISSHVHPSKDFPPPLIFVFAFPRQIKAAHQNIPKSTDFYVEKSFKTSKQQLKSASHQFNFLAA